MTFGEGGDALGLFPGNHRGAAGFPEVFVGLVGESRNETFCFGGGALEVEAWLVWGGCGWGTSSEGEEGDERLRDHAREEDMERDAVEEVNALLEGARWSEGGVGC